MPVFPVEWLIDENIKYLKKGDVVDSSVEKVIIFIFIT
jgi:hypothetical protein